MSIPEREFLIGFQTAAELLRRLLASPPPHTSPQEYMRHVARLHADSQDLRGRGLAVGCLAAVGS